jgi:hypothetical protein
MLCVNTHTKSPCLQGTCGFGFIERLSVLGTKEVLRLKFAAKLDGCVVDELTKSQFQDILVNWFRKSCGLAEVPLNTQIAPYEDPARDHTLTECMLYQLS